MAGSVIVAGARTPMGRLLGSLKDLSAMDLGGVAIKGALQRAGVRPAQVDYVIMGHVIQAGTGQITARQAAVKAGISMDVPALTINKVCLSGLDAIALADQLIRAGEFEIIVAGGMESMTQAPHILPKSREGTKYGDITMIDSMAYDALTCAFDELPMGNATEGYNSRYGLTREEQDAFSARSHQRAAEAAKNGIFDEEIVPVEIPQRKGDPLVIDTDECPRREASMESMAKLKPFFKPDGGVVTAGNASAIADGASALVVTSRKKAGELGATPIAQMLSYATAAVDPAIMGLGESKAGQMALERAGLTAKDVELAEFNEAFACVAALAIREIGVDPEIVNVNGGGVALGHPLGNTGTRMLVTLIHELERRGQEIGLTAACVGGGQGAGAVVKVEG